MHTYEQKVAAQMHSAALNLWTCPVLFVLQVSECAFGGGLQEGKGQPRAGVNTTFKQPEGEQRAA